MYLSKVKLTWEQVKNPYEQHRAIWKLFPDIQGNNANGDSKTRQIKTFLYRIEQIKKHQCANVLVQSMVKPVPDDEVELLAVRDLSINLQAEQILRFRLRANPIKQIKDERKGKVIGKNGKTYIRGVRVPLIREEEQQAWLQRRLENAANLQNLIIQKELPLHFYKAKTKNRGKIQTVLFDGIFIIKDPQALIELMQKGVGHATSFGCGLLSLAGT